MSSKYALDFMYSLLDFAETLFTKVCMECSNAGIDECEDCELYRKACRFGITEGDGWTE